MTKTNWIEDYKVEHNGECPSLPNWLAPYFELPPKSPMHKDLVVRTPSGQFYNNLSPEQKELWAQAIEWLGGDADQRLNHMRQMLPKVAPSGPAKITNAVIRNGKLYRRSKDGTLTELTG